MKIKKKEYKKYDTKIPVYDLEMSPEAPCFALACGIISHNTVPQECELREIYIPRNENSLMFHGDYSQMELRCMASMANEEQMIKAFADGKDIHRVIASKIFKVSEEEVTSQNRKYSKTATFSMTYGRSIESFADEFMSGDLQAAKNLFNSLFKEFPSLKPFMDKCHKDGLELGKIKTIFGDELQLDTNNVDTKIMRDALNWGIQSSASSIGGYSGFILYDECVKKNIKAFPTCFTHDALDFEIDTKNLFDFIDITLEVLENRVYRRFKVPAKIDWKIGINQYSTISLDEIERADDYRVYKFKAIKKGFEDIIENLKRSFNVELLETEEELEHRSLSDLFAPKTAFSKYIGEYENLIKGVIKIYM